MGQTDEAAREDGGWRGIDGAPRKLPLARRRERGKDGGTFCKAQRTIFLISLLQGDEVLIPDAMKGLSFLERTLVPGNDKKIKYKVLYGSFQNAGSALNSIADRSRRKSVAEL